MKKLLLIDGMSLSFTAYYASKASFYSEINRTKTEEELINLEVDIIKHSINIYSRFMKNIIDKEKPYYAVAAWDVTSGSETFRGKLFPEYKANRSDDLGSAAVIFQNMQFLSDLYGFNNIGCIGFEADDVIGSAISYLEKKEPSIISTIISKDRDFIQLASDNTTVKISKVGVNQLIEYTPDLIKKEFGISNLQMVDYKALVGDPSDNYKGVAGIGKVSAKKLLTEYGDIDGIYKNINSISPISLRNKIINGEDDAYLFRKVAKIKTDIPFEFKESEMVKRETDFESIEKFNSEIKKKLVI